MLEFLTRLKYLRRCHHRCCGREQNTHLYRLAQIFCCVIIVTVGCIISEDEEVFPSIVIIIEKSERKLFTGPLIPACPDTSLNLS